MIESIEEWLRKMRGLVVVWGERQYFLTTTLFIFERYCFLADYGVSVLELHFQWEGYGWTDAHSHFAGQNFTTDSAILQQRTDVAQARLPAARTHHPVTRFVWAWAKPGNESIGRCVTGWNYKLTCTVAHGCLVWCAFCGSCS